MSADNASQSFSLHQILERVSGAVVRTPGLSRVWVRAELVDFVVKGHCYTELVEKNKAGDIIARCRANCWANIFADINRRFIATTGRPLSTGMQVLLNVNATYHPTYGFSLNIVDIDPSYTLGDLEHRRREYIARLQTAGVLEHNRRLQWPLHTWRIAVVSADTAAGYGDFLNHLTRNDTNPHRLRFRTQLFPALMQGDRAPSSIIEALRRIALERNQWDGVVLVRGGGSSADLSCFENYDLAATIATFPLPVLIGLGHDRDVTLLDWVANTRTKTPTDAGAWLVARGNELLKQLQNLGNEVVSFAGATVAGCHRQLSQTEALLPVLPSMAIDRMRARINAAALQLHGICGRLRNADTRLGNYIGALRVAADTIVALRRQNLNARAAAIPAALAGIIPQQRNRLDALERLADSLSPQATLRRGYSITRINGHAITSSKDIKPGDTVCTVLSDGILTSVATIQT